MAWGAVHDDLKTLGPIGHRACAPVLGTEVKRGVARHPAFGDIAELDPRIGAAKDVVMGEVNALGRCREPPDKGRKAPPLDRLARHGLARRIA